MIQKPGVLPMQSRKPKRLKKQRWLLIVTTNLSFGQWSKAFNNDNALTVALLDRLIHHSHIIQIKGNSYRLREKKMSGSVELFNLTGGSDLKG